MTKDDYDYTVRCATCRSSFTVQMFDSHEKNLYMVDHRKWYCDRCKQAYFAKQAETLSSAHRALGFAQLAGTPKQISWAEKIRAELINKVEYLKNSQTFETVAAQQRSDRAFELFLNEWRAIDDAKWWIENRNTTVRDISKKVAVFSTSIGDDS